MPGLVRKVAIVASDHSLILHPLAPRSQRPCQSIEVRYGTNDIVTAGNIEKDYDCAFSSIETYGIVGLFTVASSSYLILISSRKQVAQIRGKSVYVISGVALIPLSSQSEARKAVDQIKKDAKKHIDDDAPGNARESEFSNDEDEQVVDADGRSADDKNNELPHPGKIKTPMQNVADQKGKSIVEDVIGKKGQYGRFAESWFSKKGWSVEKRRVQGMSMGDGNVKKTDVAQDPIVENPTQAREQAGHPQSIADSQVKVDSQAQPEALNAARTLLPKLLRTIKILFSSGSFYFSYDYDITRRLGTTLVKSSEIPLHKCVDPLYFWNRHLVSAFIDSGQNVFVLPLMQGFVGQRTFTVEAELADTARIAATAKEDLGEIIELQDRDPNSQDFKGLANRRHLLITLISRRSVLRPGLRYLRRGVDNVGSAANSVESEQVLSDPSWSLSSNLYSFTQVRGSIPLYFSQSPYSFKPIPVLRLSYDANHIAFQRHFTDLITRYGDVQIASLVNKHGGELEIGEAYEAHIGKLNNEGGINSKILGSEWFDFHTVCRGMKFENVKILVESLATTMDRYGFTMESDGKIQRRQSGVLRTNCMDCLDRTNVVQSAFAQRALEQQLAADGTTINFQSDQSTQWFNTLWADNGDAISKQYSSTAALKGDYTRTRKRDYRGALHDFGLTLSRYYNNIVNDYFSQAAIDYLIGNVTDQVFEDFEADMMSGDPAVSMNQIRHNAIDNSSRIVIADKTEELMSGWTLLSPQISHTLRTFPFIEVVLLLTDAAVYAVRFDWNLEKVSSFERVDLRSIVKITRGIYITSTLAPAQTDEVRNVGLVIQYRPGKEDIVKVNTRSMSTSVTIQKEAKERPQLEGLVEQGETDDVSGPDAQLNSPKHRQPSTSETRVLALKALPVRSSFTHGDQNMGETQLVSEGEHVRNICEEIRRVSGSSAESFVEEKDIISLAEASKSTGLLEHLGHSLRKLVWA